MNTYTDSHYRYPGSRPFYDNEIDRRLFFGRNKETRLLLHEILTATLVVLFGKSGLGKTSLVNAGLNQKLRDRGFVPLNIRFNAPGVEPQQALFDGIRDIVDREHLDYEPGEEDSLWQFFKTAAFWGSDNTLLKPVLILDQFEEFFALHSPETRKKFTWQLADVVNNTVPIGLSRSIPAGEPFPYSDKPPNVKIVISIREDCLGQLEEMSQVIPGILRHRFRLLPLSCEQAKQAIVEPSRVQDELIGADSFEYSQAAVNMMVNFLCKRTERGVEKMTNEVESFQLQLLCRHIEDKVREKSAAGKGEAVVETDDLGGEQGMRSVLQRFYDDQVKQLDSLLKRSRTRKLCEEGLISVEDRRLSLEEREIERTYKISKPLLAELVNRRLLRSEPRVGSIYYELSHDTLVAPIRESQKKRNLKRMITGLSIIGIFVFLVMGYLTLFEREDQSDRINRINKLDVDAGKLKTYGKYEEAVKKYNALLKIDKNNVNAHFELGDAYHKLGKYNDAIKEYKKAIEIDPAYILPKINLAAVYLIEKDFKEADKLVNEVLKDKKISPQYILTMKFVSISSLLIQKKHSELIDQLNEFIGYYNSLKEDYLKTWDYSLSENLISTLPLQEQEKSLLIEFIDILKSPLEEGKQKLKESETTVYNIIGNAHLALGKDNEAIEAFEKAIGFDPQNIIPKMNLAAMYLIKKDFEKSDKLAKEVLKEEKVRIEYKLIMKGICIASLMFQGKQQQAKKQWKEFSNYYNSLEKDYDKAWDYELSKKLVRDQDLPLDQKIKLLIFLDILGSPLEEGRKKLDQLEALLKLF